MSTINKTAQAILNNNFDEAREHMKSGEEFSGSYVQNNHTQIINKILRAKAFDLIDALIKHGSIETDVYEYERFDNSIFSNISYSLQTDETSIAFLNAFLQKIQNINDEVKGETVLGYCLEEGADPAVIKCLIDAGCNAHYKNNAEQNLIYSAVSKNMMKEEKTIAYINLLVENGVDVNDKDITGTTPLLRAVQDHKLALIPVLLQQGANVNEQDKAGNTAFYYAVAQQMSSGMYEQLSAAASPVFAFEQVNKNGQTLLTEFTRSISESDSGLKLLAKLISDGADLRQTADWYGKPKSGVDWIAEKKAGVLKAVLDAGVININEQDNNGNTLLHQVCAYNVNFDADAAKEVYRKVKLLLENGADANLTNDKDETPLMLASGDNLKIKTVELLMSKK